MKVLKFGGTSVGSVASINQVINIVSEQPQPLIVVVSAMGGITDVLLHCGQLAAEGNDSYREKLEEAALRHMQAVKELIPVQQQSSLLSLVKKHCNEIEDICKGAFLLSEFSARTKDKLMSYGELLSAQIIATAMQAKGIKAGYKDARQLIRTNSNFGNALVDFAYTNNQVSEWLKSREEIVWVLPGFIAADAQQVTTTLGRGGSDYTAAIMAAAVNASSLEIWTDVSGMMTADPRWVQHAKVIPQISYQEAMELSHFGAKVIYPPTIQPVMKKNIPVWIKNTFEPQAEGTVILNQARENGSSIRGISSMSRISLLSLEGSGMVGIPGFSRRLFEALSNEHINVILITQSSSEHSICVAIDAAFAAAAKTVVDKAFETEISTGSLEPLAVEEDLAILALVGDNMKNHSGISGRMFATMGRNGVNIRAIAQGSSERNISAVISSRDARKAINVLHEAFFQTAYKQVNLFIAGVGNVGSKLLNQLQLQQPYLEQKLKLQLRVTGLANSKKNILSDEGINLNNWQSLLNDAPDASIDNFTDAMIQRNLRNTVFVDITANDSVATVYNKLLEKSIAVVACNKVAASSAYSNYKNLKDLSAAYNAPFLFETNVGAGLPIIGTLGDLLRSGDKIHRMEAVLSGTLNFVFNNYDGSRPFATVVKQAQEEGYTEPDPRLDLGGTDVMRKIMILARETGAVLEMEDIANNSFMPAACMQGDVNDFYAAMEKEEAHFQQLYKAAAASNCKLKFVASFNDGKASVGLQHIPPQHDLYHLYGKDNIVLFYTDRYPEQPLVIKGAGAGAEVTASGVFADIMRAAGI
jgi:bifunctional aspartokinase / homoserine dehydrogenase 1